MFWINYLLWHYFGKVKGISVNSICTIYLSNNFPTFGQGIHTGKKGVFVKRVFYKDSNTVSIADTEDVMKHELAHQLLREQIGFWRYWGWIFKDYVLLFFIKHDNKSIEKEVNKLKNIIQL
jgi:hypothetical protein